MYWKRSCFRYTNQTIANMADDIASSMEKSPRFPRKPPSIRVSDIEGSTSIQAAMKQTTNETAQFAIPLILNVLFTNSMYLPLNLVSPKASSGHIPSTPSSLRADALSNPLIARLNLNCGIHPVSIDLSLQSRHSFQLFIDGIECSGLVTTEM